MSVGDRSPARRSPLRAVASAGLMGAGVAAFVQAAPAVTSLGPLRRWATPGLAGLGRPDHVALTFDDGPHSSSTPRFLDQLEVLGVRATFFLLGEWVTRERGLVAEMVAAGHEVAVHGYTHRCLAARGPRGTYDDLARARDVIADAAGTVPSWYRPPYGVLTTSGLAVARALALRPVLWTAWGRDWTARASGESVYRTALRDLGPGGTILLHDSDVTSAPGAWRSALAAFPRLVEACRQREWTVGPLAEHGLPVT